MRSVLSERMELLEDETLYPFAERSLGESKVFFLHVCGIHREGRKAKLTTNISY